MQQLGRSQRVICEVRWGTMERPSSGVLSGPSGPIGREFRSETLALRPVPASLGAHRNKAPGD